MNTITRFVNEKPQATGLICAALASIIFGLHPPAERAVYAAGGNAVCIALLAIWARGLSMALYCGMKKLPLFQTREDCKQALIGGACQAYSSLAIIWAVQYLPGPVVIIIAFTNTLMLLFFMAWRGEIKLDIINSVTTILALLGLTLVLNLWREQSGLNWTGVIIALSSAVFTASRVYVYGRETKARNPIIVGAENLLVAAVLTLIALFFQAPRLPATFVGDAYLLLTCLSFAVGSFFMFWGISRLGSFQYSLMAKLEPIFTSLFSVLLLNEILNPTQYAGVALTVGSLAAYQLMSRSKTNQACKD